MNIYLSNAISWGVACLCSYILNKSWTFRSADTGFSPFAKFVAVNLGSLGLGLMIMYVLVSWGCGKIWSYLFSLPVTMMASYLGYRFWSFKLFRE
jgi:putative flippase GtrA